MDKKPKIKKIVEAEDWKNKYLRALADYQNLEKRISNNNSELIKNANRILILRLLPFLDHLDKAEVFVKDQGLKIAKEQLLNTLKEAGLEEIEVLNKPFDPVVAEAIEIVKGDMNDQVVEVLKKGYRLGDNILRVAQVKVSKKI